MAAKYMTVGEVAEQARTSTKTVFLNLRAKDLHGTQRVKGGTWLVREECSEAWIEGRPCPHQSTNVTSLRRRSAS